MKRQITIYTLSLIFLLFVATHFNPVSAQSSCTCRPVGNDYKVGTWTDGAGNACNKSYGVCALNCIISELETGKCIERCIDPNLSCNPMTETTLDVGFKVPTFTVLMSNLIKLLFFLAGIMAIFQLLMGGFLWVLSGGDDKKIGEAQKRITSAIIGLIVMISSLSIVIFLEQVIFGGRFCLGISCPINVQFLQLIR